MDAASVATRRQVAEYFLRLEADKNDSLAIKLASGIFSNDDDFFQQYRAYANICKNEKRDSPVLVWTIGVPGDNRFRDIKEWRLEKVNLDQLYSCAMGKNMGAELDAVSGNLKMLTSIIKNNPSKYTEFDLSRIPSYGDKQIAIGVAHSINGHQGSVELIDGAHRVVSMIANDENCMFVYLAVPNW